MRRAARCREWHGIGYYGWTEHDQPDGRPADTSTADPSGSEDGSEDSAAGNRERCSNLGPDLHFTFDGHLDDVSGNGYHGVAVFESRVVTGLDGDALVFDADHPHLTVNSFASAFQAAL